MSPNSAVFINKRIPPSADNKASFSLPYVIWNFFQLFSPQFFKYHSNNILEILVA